MTDQDLPKRDATWIVELLVLGFFAALMWFIAGPELVAAVRDRLRELP